jgi:hypothetical protein
MVDSVSGRRRIPPRDTAPHADETDPRKTRFAERHQARCRTDRCRWAASAPTGPTATPDSRRRPPIASGRTTTGRVGRPGCGPPTARPGEHNSPQASRSAREEVRGEGEPQDERDDGEEEEDEPCNRDERRYLAFARLLDLVQVFRFLFEPLDGVAQPGKRSPIEGAGMVCCVPTLRHDSMVRER